MHQYKAEDLRVVIKTIQESVITDSSSFAQELAFRLPMYSALVESMSNFELKQHIIAEVMFGLVECVQMVGADFLEEIRGKVKPIELLTYKELAHQVLTRNKIGSEMEWVVLSEKMLGGGVFTDRKKNNQLNSLLNQFYSNDR